MAFGGARIIGRKTFDGLQKAATSERRAMGQNKFPPGWDEQRVQKVLENYEEQTEEETVAEDEAAFGDPIQTVMEVPNELVPEIRELIARHTA